MPSDVLLLHSGLRSIDVPTAGRREYVLPLLGAAQNSCGVLAGSLSSTTQQVEGCPLMVATARVWPRAPGLRLLQTSTRWERLQDVEPALLLPAWLFPDVSCTTVHPGVVLVLGPPKEDAEEEEEAL